MKHVKKLASVLLAMVMVMAMTMTAFAATADLTNHTYKAYQIFSGTQADEQDELAQIEWGDGVNGAALLEALRKAGDVYNNCTTAADVAAKLGEEGADADGFAKIAYKHIISDKGIVVVNGQTELEAGYYLVVDETSFESDATNTVKNLALLQLTNKGPFDIQNKTSIPEVEKKVQDINDSTDSGKGELQDSADYDIGDKVPFTLTGTLPSNYADYDTYKYVFHDTLSEGLTYDENTVKVYVVSGSEETEITGSFTIKLENNSLTISCNDLKSIENVTIDSNSKIVVRYTATLNDEAKVGYEGNPNTVYLEYSNNPNNSGEGNNETGKTPEDKVIVFTYQLDVTKTDGTSELPGAGFTLYKQNPDESWTEVTKIKAGEGTTFSFKGLDDGTYKLEETTVPDGYNKAADIIFTITANHEEDSVDPKLTGLTVNNTAITVEMTQAADGETGYYTGVLSTVVINNQGGTLPETGGMGTTIFYVIGSILVLGAAVVMITRKRMAK